MIVVVTTEHDINSSSIQNREKISVEPGLGIPASRSIKSRNMHYRNLHRSIGKHRILDNFLNPLQLSSTIRIKIYSS